MREDVKDLLDRAAGWYSPPPIRAEDVRTRGERRRRSGRVVAAAVALSVFVAAGALTWTAFRPQRTGVGEEPVVQDVSSSVLGVSLTYPEDWTLVDLWPLARSIASWPEPIGTTISVPDGTNERGGLPVLQLSNVDLGLRSVCGTETTADEAVLYVAVNGGPYLLASDGAARWSGELTQDDGPCGPGWYAYRHSTEDNGDGATGERPFLVFARVGPDASTEDRRIVFDAYDSLSFAPADILHPPAEESPRYVTPDTDPTPSDVLLVTCEPAGPPEVSTPVVRAHPDGIHIQVQGVPDTEALLVRSSSRPGWAWSSGSNGIDDELVMAVTPGEAYVTCFAGGPSPAPSPGAARQDNEVAFKIVNPDSQWISTELTCRFGPDPSNYGGEVASASETIDGAARRIIPGILQTDVVERAGYPDLPGNHEEIRVIRDGEVIAWANGFEFRGETWSLDVTACQGSGVADA